jgi:hypothetical protein
MQFVRDAKVHELDGAVLQNHDVGWLEIPVNDSLLVNVGESVQDLFDPGAAALPFGRPGQKGNVAQRAPVNPFHHQVRVRTDRHGQNLHDVRVLETQADLDFPQKTLVVVLPGDEVLSHLRRDFRHAAPSSVSLAVSNTGWVAQLTLFRTNSLEPGTRTGQAGSFDPRGLFSCGKRGRASGG